MKNLTLLLFSSILLSLLIITSCNKDNEIIDVPGNPSEIVVNPPMESITANVYGRVVTADNAPIVDAAVTINNMTLTTDENGLFNAKDIAINGYGNLVSVTAPGYFQGARLIESIDGTDINTTIKLIEKSMKGSVNASSGGDIMIGGKNQLALGASSIQDSDGNIYDGTVNVYAEWLDPTDINTLQTMPGDLRAVNSDSDIMQLATFGMLAVELEAPDGSALNIADGSTAQLSFEVPNDLLDAAPTSIPLWFFDEATGYWIEDGEATLVDGVYVGDVSHFSFWNCDVPYPLVEVEGSVVNGDGVGISNVLVEIIIAESVISGCSYTDGAGGFFGKIPKNESLIINIYNSCNQLVYTAEIGPFDSDVILDPIVIDDSEYIVHFSGSVVSCDGNPVTNGNVLVEYQGGIQFLYTDDEGNFSSAIDICEGTDAATVTAYNVDDLQQSTPIEVDINGQTNIDLGILSTCDELTEYFFYEMDGITYTMQTAYAQTAIDSSGLETYIYLSGSINNTSGFSTIGIPMTDGPGTYTPEYALLFTDTDLVGIFEPGLGSMTITFTELGYNIGDEVEATFDGMIDLGGNDLVEFSGEFKSILQ
jgi:hypothetical protein